jgi:TPR repeat protein
MGRKELFTVALTAALFVAAGTGATARADFNDGVTAYEAGDYEAAFKEWLPLAQNNDPAAMRNIGHMYRRGLGVEQDYTKAMTWYKRAATIGLDRAQANVAGMYLEGEGVEQDYAQAANWFARAAQQGHVVSQYNLGLLLENGLGVEQNDQRALGWFALAAKAGHPQAKVKAAELAARIKSEQANGATSASGGPLIKQAEASETAPAPQTPVKEVIQEATTAEETADETETIQAATPTASEPAEDLADTTADSTKGVQKKGFYEALKSLVVSSAGTSAGDEVVDTPAPATDLKPDAADVGTKTAMVPAPAPKPASTIVPAPKPAEKPQVAAVPQKPVAVAAIPAPEKRAPAPTKTTLPKAQAVATGSGLSPTEKLEMADLAYTLKQYQQSLGIWAQLAADGNAEAQYRLGGLFNAGVAVPVDRVRAYYWWDKARENGSTEAAAALADLEPRLTHLEKRQIDRVN